MNRSAIIKPVVDSPSRNSRLRAAMGLLCIGWIVMLTWAVIPGLAFARGPCTGIHVQIGDIRNSKGTVACALFESPIGFPTEYLHSAINIMVIKIRKSQARCDFEDIPQGRYALAVVHDENMNGRLDTNVLGIPKEGYGFSNDATGVIGAPSFGAASFTYDGQDLDMTISLHY